MLEPKDWPAMVLPMPSQWHVSGYSRAGEATVHLPPTVIYFF
jgi:hypothetical protein